MSKGPFWLSSLALLSACSTTAPIKSEDVSKELNSALPDGSSFDAVSAYLNNKGYNDGSTISGDDLIDNATNVNMGSDPNTYELKSIIRDVRKSMLVSTSITMTFVFDREKRLIDIRVKDVHTGL